MHMLAGLLLALCLIAPAMEARAQATLPDSENGRYTFSQRADEVLRLDTRTGAITVCRRKANDWVCETVADERAALEKEIARLQAENVALKKELISRGAPLPGVSERTSPPRDPELRLPNDAELDRAMAFLEKMWRRLVEMVQRVQQDFERKG